MPISLMQKYLMVLGRDRFGLVLRSIAGTDLLQYLPLTTDAKDHSGNDYNGTATDVSFSSGYGVFNGTSSFISCDGVAALLAAFDTTEYTIIVAFRPNLPVVDAMRTWHIRAGFADARTEGRAYSGAASTVRVYNASTGTDHAQFANEVLAHQWYTMGLTVTKTGNAQKTFVDGVQVGSTTANPDVWNPAAPVNWKIGSNNTGDGTFWNGHLRYFTVINKAVSDAEMLRLHEAT